ncbi:hypothetical protein CGZ93_13825 [Enemella dayhoffiae]|uniref:Uncharacterized protein n=1 Tax=Enemella dayhoffiae TaxID=2016507 RepID=A0A255GUS8_9ACTN|nr:hypothetical protein [Enemella dayhoffiae]OYO19428.1 hypothetical protein CGZ93_13825 [Enemella dayhoffiae]
MTDWNLDDDDAWDGLSSPAVDPVGDQVDEPELGGDLVSDGSGAVAVAVDDEHRVVRVVISNNWRNKAGQGLAAAVREAALRATEPLTLADPEIASFSLMTGRTPKPNGTVLDHPMSQLEVNQLLEETLQTFERLEKLDQRGDVRHRTYDYTPAIGRSDNEKVRVELDLQMRPDTISIDQPWVEGVRVERIVASLQQALTRAYAEWRPPVVVPGEYDEVRDQALALRKRTLRPVLIAGGWISEDEEL